MYFENRGGSQGAICLPARDGRSSLSADERSRKRLKRNKERTREATRSQSLSGIYCRPWKGTRQQRWEECRPKEVEMAVVVMWKKKNDGE